MSLSRRDLLRVGLGGTAAATAGQLVGAPEAGAQPQLAAQTVPFYGKHQAGITTPPPERLVLAAFDVAAHSAASVRLVLRQWSIAAERMTRGRPAAPGGGLAVPPPDSGETVGYGPQHLTVTFGFGPTMFTKLGMERARPQALQPLPAMPGDALDPAYCGGDLVVQACADTEIVALHAVRQLIRMGAPVLVPRWLQTGYGPAARPPETRETPRNPLGFKDGTGNPRPGSKALDDALWIQGRDKPGWAREGTYLAVRRILIHTAKWDADSLAAQQNSVGREKVSGAPLTGGTEFTPPKFDERRNGRLVIPAHAHIRVARPQDGELPMLRRGVTFDDGLGGGGHLVTGQLFLAFVRNLHAQFVPALTRVTEHDRMTERYTTHVGSAVFVVPPGAAKGGYVGETLFG
ncbi:MAG TPA: Dyp-type peroxidase [Jatrophihabitans sp.]|nr:Dyp-type peroxidase [Jatrophihabitans sp.]